MSFSLLSDFHVLALTVVVTRNGNTNGLGNALWRVCHIRHGFLLLRRWSCGQLLQLFFSARLALICRTCIPDLQDSRSNVLDADRDFD